jgi:hypothetical protein
MSVQKTADANDSGRIRVGAAFRLPVLSTPALQVTPNPLEVADTGRIRLGAAFRLLSHR